VKGASQHQQGVGEKHFRKKKLKIRPCYFKESTIRKGLKKFSLLVKLENMSFRYVWLSENYMILKGKRTYTLPAVFNLSPLQHHLPYLYLLLLRAEEQLLPGVMIIAPD